MQFTIVHVQVKPQNVQVFIEASRPKHVTCKTAAHAALHKQPRHYPAWVDTGAYRMQQRCRDVSLTSLFPQHAIAGSVTA